MLQGREAPVASPDLMGYKEVVLWVTLSSRLSLRQVCVCWEGRVWGKG